MRCLTLGLVSESVWNGLMLKTYGTMSISNQRRVQMLGDWNDARELRDQLTIGAIITSLSKDSVTPAPKNLHKWPMENLRSVWRTYCSISLPFLSGLFGL